MRPIFYRILIAFLLLSSFAYAGDLKHPSFPLAVHNGEPLLFGQQGSNTPSYILNVQAAPYNAVADSVTDAGPAIQQAIYDIEGATPPTFPTAPLGGFGTIYLPKSPLPASSSRRCYAISKPLRVASGPIEIKGDSGTCIQKLFAGPTVINENWGIDNLQYGPALVGTGQSMSTVGYSNGGAPANKGLIDLAQFINTTQHNFATLSPTGFDIEFWLEPVSFNGGQVNIFASNPNNPASGNGMFNIHYTGAGNNQVAAAVETTGGLVSLTACPAQTANNAYDIALDWDGTTYRLFQGGVLCNSSASSNAPVLGPFESMQLPALGGFDYWMVGGSGSSPFQGYIDSLRIELQSEHATNYTPPTARFVADGPTLLLLNWDASIDGTQIGYATGFPWHAYLPVLEGGSITGGDALHLHDMELCGDDGNQWHRGDGLFSQWAVNSEIDHISCTNATYAGLNFYNNDYGTFEHDNFVDGGLVGILHGVAWNGSLAQNDRMDGQAIACEETVGDGGGGFHDIHEGCTNRGGLYYCKMYMGEAFGGLIDFDGCDQEAGDSNYVATILNANPGVALQFNTPILTEVSGKPLILQTGSSAVYPGPVIIAPDIIGAGASYLIKYVTAPSTAAKVTGALGSLPATNIANGVALVGCQGTVTLSGGTGTATDSCIPASGFVPTCIDVTAFNGGICTPSAGSMAITGTGSDVIKWSF